MAGHRRHQLDGALEHHQIRGAADDRRRQRWIGLHDQFGGWDQGCPRLRHYCARKFGIRVNSIHPYGTYTPMGNDLSMYQVFQDHPHYIHSFSPGALPTDSLADSDLVSDIIVWLAGDNSSLITAAQIPTDKSYLKI
jgi:hypothetical protein